MPELPVEFSNERSARLLMRCAVWSALPLTAALAWLWQRDASDPETPGPWVIALAPAVAALFWLIGWWKCPWSYLVDREGLLIRCGREDPKRIAWFEMEGFTASHQILTRTGRITLHLMYFQGLRLHALLERCSREKSVPRSPIDLSGERPSSMWQTVGLFGAMGAIISGVMLAVGHEAGTPAPWWALAIAPTTMMALAGALLLDWRRHRRSWRIDQRGMTTWQRGAAPEQIPWQNIAGLSLRGGILHLHDGRRIPVGLSLEDGTRFRTALLLSPSPIPQIRPSPNVEIRSAALAWLSLSGPAAIAWLYAVRHWKLDRVWLEFSLVGGLAAPVFAWCAVRLQMERRRSPALFLALLFSLGTIAYGSWRLWQLLHRAR